jgi:hypothetical protein
MEIGRKVLVLILLMSPSGVCAQSSVPVGTVLPAQLSSSLNSQKTKPGKRITARIMQDVPLPSRRKIRAGAKVIGHVESVKAAQNGQSSEIMVHFDRLEFGHRSVSVNTSLRALASMMEVEDAQIPPAGTDRGTPWAWTTRNLIGGEVAYGEGGPVVHGADIVGRSLFGGVLVAVKASPGSGCRGEVAGNSQPQALWVFSSDACGVYGIDEVQITHAGRTSPLGEITLTSKTGNVDIKSGSGMLLRVNDSNPQ